MRRSLPLVLAALVLLVAACGTDDVECTSNDRCGLGLSCVGGLCVRVDAGEGDTDVDIRDTDVGNDTDVEVPDTDAGVDTDTGVDTDAGADTDVGVDSDTGIDTDTGNDPDTGIDADADAATGVSCVDDTPCGPLYLCDTDAGLCFDTCTDGSECAVGVQCDLGDGAGEGACVALPEEPYSFVYVTSEVPYWDEGILSPSTPGPDIDGVSLQRGDTLYDRPTLEEGLVGWSEFNDADRISDGINNDSMTGEPPEFDCDLDRGFVSLGDREGFIAYSFDVDELLDGDILRVYELDAFSCPDDVGSVWTDSYGVLLGRGDVPRVASDARAQGCWQDFVYGGGYAEVTVDLGSCAVPEFGVRCSHDDDCPNSATCEDASGRCHAGCTEVGDECAPGYVCEGADDDSAVRGTCESVPVFYDLVVVYSDTDPDSDEVLDSPTPGPDIDYVEVVRDGVGYGADFVDGWDAGTPDPGWWSDPDAALDRDSMIGDEIPYDCEFGDDATWVSIGGSDSGYLAMSFGGVVGINDGDTVVVYEGSHVSCSDVPDVWLEPYSVYVESSLDRDVECELGNSPEDGGVTEFVFDRSACP